MQLTYFCGSHFQCANSTNTQALQVRPCIRLKGLRCCFQMAKNNLETRYSVVGLIEHFNTSIAVMEQYLPGKASQKHFISRLE